MKTIHFNAVVGEDQVIRPPAGVSIPEGEIEVSVRPRPTTIANLETRLQALCVRRGLNPDIIDKVTRFILLEELVHEDLGTVSPRPGPGYFKGAITYMAPDFDAPLEDMKEYIE